MSQHLSKKQKDILAFIDGFITDHHFSPTYREIGEAVSLKSVASVSYQIQQLAAAGRIRIYEGRNRAITILDSADALSSSAKNNKEKLRFDATERNQK